MIRKLSSIALVCAAVMALMPLVAEAAEWAPNVFYSVGALVTYQGPTYKCLQAHTSLVGWEPSTTPALWQLQSGGGSPTPTPAPTATPVPGATNTPTPRPGGGGSCTAPTWNATTAYTGGQSVTWNGRTYRAKWWTQNEQPPGTSGVWEDLGPCSGGGGNPTPTPTPTTP